jgi:Tfp pilus assembly protein PilP
MKKSLVLIALLVLVGCEKKSQLPSGFELIGTDGNAHFVYVAPENYGEKVRQREAGRIICTEIFDNKDYCEVYYWKEKKDVPVKFPIVNRKTLIGLYKMKGEQITLKALTGDKVPGEVQE